MTKKQTTYDILKKAYEKTLTKILLSEEPDTMYDFEITYKTYKGETITFSWQDGQARLELLQDNLEINKEQP